MTRHELHHTAPYCTILHHTTPYCILYHTATSPSQATNGDYIPYDVYKMRMFRRWCMRLMMTDDASIKCQPFLPCVLAHAYTRTWLLGSPLFGGWSTHTHILYIYNMFMFRFIYPRPPAISNYYAIMCDTMQ